MKKKHGGIVALLLIAWSQAKAGLLAILLGGAVLIVAVYVGIHIWSAANRVNNEREARDRGILQNFGPMRPTPSDKPSTEQPGFSL